MFIHFILLVRCYHACYMPQDLCVYVFCSMFIFFNLFVVVYVLFRNGRKHVFIASTAPQETCRHHRWQGVWDFLIMFAIVLKDVTVCDWYDLVQVLDRKTFTEFIYTVLDENAVQS